MSLTLPNSCTALHWAYRLAGCCSRDTNVSIPLVGWGQVAYYGAPLVQPGAVQLSVVEAGCVLDSAVVAANSPVQCPPLVWEGTCEQAQSWWEDSTCRQNGEGKHLAWTGKTWTPPTHWLPLAPWTSFSTPPLGDWPAYWDGNYLVSQPPDASLLSSSDFRHYNVYRSIEGGRGVLGPTGSVAVVFPHRPGSQPVRVHWTLPDWSLPTYRLPPPLVEETPLDLFFPLHSLVWAYALNHHIYYLASSTDGRIYATHEPGTVPSDFPPRPPHFEPYSWLSRQWTGAVDTALLWEDVWLLRGNTGYSSFHAHTGLWTDHAWPYRVDLWAPSFHLHTLGPQVLLLSRFLLLAHQQTVWLLPGPGQSPLWTITLDTPVRALGTVSLELSSSTHWIWVGCLQHQLFSILYHDPAPLALLDPWQWQSLGDPLPYACESIWASSTGSWVVQGSYGTSFIIDIYNGKKQIRRWQTFEPLHAVHWKTPTILWLQWSTGWTLFEIPLLNIE
jgi:hypothetical protein